METNRRTAARAVAAVLTTDGLLHLFWMTGSHWPADNTKALSYAVLGADVPFTPPVLPRSGGLLPGAARHPQPPSLTRVIHPNSAGAYAN